jgi:hypothetical protein
MRDYEGLTRLALGRLMTKPTEKIPPSAKSVLGDSSGTAIIFLNCNEMYSCWKFSHPEVAV